MFICLIIFCIQAEKEAENCQFLILSDRSIGPDRVPIPALLVAGALHQHLIAKRLRSKCAIIVDTGEAR